MPIDFTAYKFSNAVIPIDFIICGVKLKPFSLGHMMILEHIGNPMMSPTTIDVSMVDGLYHFFQSLIVCGQSYEDNLGMFNDEFTYRSTMEQFVSNLKKNMESEKDWNIYTKINLFKTYISFYVDIPKYTHEHEEKPGMPSGTDWKQNIFLCFKKLGYTETEILNMSFKRLFYEWCSYAESEGAIKTWNKLDVSRYGEN